MREGGPVNRFRFLQRGSGRWIALRRAGEWLLAPVYHQSDCYLVFVHIHPGHEVSSSELVDDWGTHVEMVKEASAFEAYRDEMHPALPYARLLEYLAEGGDRFLALARRPLPGQQNDRVIAYRKAERGVFSYWHRRVHTDVGPEYCMIHNNEVAPDYRGQNVSGFVRHALFDYFRKIGVRTTLGAISTHNHASLRAHMKSAPHYTPVCGPMIRRVRLLGGLVDRATAPDTIRTRIEEESRRFWG